MDIYIYMIYIYMIYIYIYPMIGPRAQQDGLNKAIQLMAEILHQLIGSLTHYLQGFIHPRWCRISSINSINWG